MAKPFPLLLILSLPLLMGFNSPGISNEESLVFLKTDSLEAGFLPGVGGRLVFLARTGGVNLLKSDSTLWNEAPEKRVVPSPKSNWKAYYGHIVWPGPQSKWWTQQDLNEARRNQASSWPPDPYLIYSSYRVVEQTPVQLIMESPPSPVTGIRLTKKYTLTNSGLDIQVRMTNSSDKAVSWDIWSNTRFEGKSLFFVPDCEKGVLKITKDESGRANGFDGEIVERAFTFSGEVPKSAEKRRYAKAFLHPELGKIVLVREHTMMVISFDFVEQSQIHPEQGFVEIYKMLTPDGKGDLLELEHHSAYVTLQPGESHVLNESWYISNYSGGSDLLKAVTYYNQIAESK